MSCVFKLAVLLQSVELNERIRETGFILRLYVCSLMLCGVHFICAGLEKGLKKWILKGLQKACGSSHVDQTQRASAFNV